MLHIVKSSPFASHALKNCINRLQPEDGLLLIEDGVYAIQQSQQWQPKLDKRVKLYVLQDDAIARGIATDKIEINCIDYDDFVQLTLEYSNSMSW